MISTDLPNHVNRVMGWSSSRFTWRSMRALDFGIKLPSRNIISGFPDNMMALVHGRARRLGAIVTLGCSLRFRGENEMM